MSDTTKAAEATAQSPAKGPKQEASAKKPTKDQTKRESAHERHEREVAQLHEDNVKRHLEYHPAEVHSEVEPLTGQPVEIHASAGQVFLNSHGEKAFEREGWIQFRKQVEAAFQVVA